MSEEVKVERKKRSLSLIQPTSIPTLGNYLGAMKGWSAFQEEYDTIYGVADLHFVGFHSVYIQHPASGSYSGRLPQRNGRSRGISPFPVPAEVPCLLFLR